MRIMIKPIVFYRPFRYYKISWWITRPGPKWPECADWTESLLGACHIRYTFKTCCLSECFKTNSLNARIRTCFHAVWSESSMGAFWIAKNAKFLHAPNDDSDQPARMRRLIRVVVGRTYQKVRFLKLWIICLWLWTKNTSLHTINTTSGFSLNGARPTAHSRPSTPYPLYNCTLGRYSWRV